MGGGPAAYPFVPWDLHLAKGGDLRARPLEEIFLARRDIPAEHRCAPPTNTQSAGSRLGRACPTANLEDGRCSASHGIHLSPCRQKQAASHSFLSGNDHYGMMVASLTQQAYFAALGPSPTLCPSTHFPPLHRRRLRRDGWSRDRRCSGCQEAAAQGPERAWSRHSGMRTISLARSFSVA
jgi:hypothetical protein